VILEIVGHSTDENCLISNPYRRFTIPWSNFHPVPSPNIAGLQSFSATNVLANVSFGYYPLQSYSIVTLDFDWDIRNNNPPVGIDKISKGTYTSPANVWVGVTGGEPLAFCSEISDPSDTHQGCAVTYSADTPVTIVLQAEIFPIKATAFKLISAPPPIRRSSPSYPLPKPCVKPIGPSPVVPVPPIVPGPTPAPTARSYRWIWMLLILLLIIGVIIYLAVSRKKQVAAPASQ
jgi:hypothetical protein